MQLVCSKCGAAIPADQVNVKADLARCAACGHLAKASALLDEAPENLQPPEGSRATFSVDDQGNGVIDIPAAGVRGIDVALMFFTALWTLFIAAWTAVAVALTVGGGPPIAAAVPALCSVPFWIIAGLLWKGLINGVRERQRIELRPEALVFRRLRPIRPSATTIAYEDLEGVGIELWRPAGVTTMIAMMRHQARTRSAWFVGRLVPCFTHGGAKTYFAEEATEVEMQWIVRVLKAAIHKLSGRQV